MNRSFSLLTWVGRVLALLCLVALAVPASPVHAQGVTTSSVTGIVKDPQGLAVPGATVVAVHDPSGTKYETVSREDGRFSMPGMRIGGPYTVTASLEGFQPFAATDIILNLGVATDLTLTLQAATVAETVTVSATSDPIFSSERTGAATAVSREALERLPTISGRLESFARMTPQSGGTLSFAGQDNRMNNITVDGSVFNNSFGLAGAPGERTGVAPISVQAIEQVQINIAPYDVRQGNFVGAGVNTVTRSGGNQFSGSFYYQARDNDLVGTEAKDQAVNPGTFNYSNWGGWASGPIVRNRAFFFFSGEDEEYRAPGTTFRANAGGESVAGNTTRVLARDLNNLSSYLGSNFKYDTGPYQDYSFLVPATRLLGKVDYNLNNSNKLSFRYNHLDSVSDQLVSNSSSLGFGTRRTNTTGLNFAGSNYAILENIRSFIGEWNSTIGSNIANRLIAGYTSQDESREYRGDFFPFVDVLEAGSVYTSFGFEPFTPNNQLRYNTFQIQDSFTWFKDKHTFTFGASTERYESENVFFPGRQSVYVYNSLNDFYADANDYLANPNRTTSPVTLRTFQVRWMNIPGLEEPVQPLQVWYSGFYAQDEWQARDNLKVTYGLRLDVPVFGDTGYQNVNADALTFRDEAGNPVQYQTAKLPDPQVLWSPRAGFNWALDESRRTQVRGGTGIFTGRPAYVWISNQIGNTGVLTGFERLDNTRNRPFHPDPDRYKPTTPPTGAPAASYELALTDPNFRFPQIWRSNIAVDRKLPWGWTGTVEYIYNRDVNGIYYVNANLPAAQTRFSGADARPRWTSNRIHSNVANAVVLKNQDVGRSWDISLSAEKSFKRGFFAKGAYRYGEARNTVDPGSIALGSWDANPIAGDPNNPILAYSAGSPGHRMFIAAAYRFEYFKFGATNVSVFWEGFTNGNLSYRFSGDLNGDSGTNNDLIYVHRDVSEMNFQTFTASGRTFTAAEQAQAWNTYIEADNYLRQHRGEYAERFGVFLPMVFRTDLSVSQDLFTNIKGKKNNFQVRLDILNFSNLLNNDWGVGQRLVNSQPLIVPTTAQGGPADAQGRAQYRLRVVNGQLMTKPLEQTAGLADVWRMQFSLRYTFN